MILYCGDYREVLSALAPIRFDAIIADPPYQQTSLEWDRWPNDWLSVVAQYSDSLWCWGTLRLFMNRASEFTAAGWHLSQDIVWEKHNGTGASTDRFRRVHEQAAHFYRGKWSDIYHVCPKTMDARPRRVIRRKRPAHWGDIGASAYATELNGPRLFRSVIQARSMHGSAKNETQKPENVTVPLVEYVCPVGGTILVPFAGSGTECVTARRLGRRAVGIECRESQCKIAAERLRDLR